MKKIIFKRASFQIDTSQCHFRWLRFTQWYWLDVPRGSGPRIGSCHHGNLVQCMQNTTVLWDRWRVLNHTPPVHPQHTDALPSCFGWAVVLAASIRSLVAKRSMFWIKNEVRINIIQFPACYSYMCVCRFLRIWILLECQREKQRLVSNLLSSIDSERLVPLAGYFGWEANQCCWMGASAIRDFLLRAQCGHIICLHLACDYSLMGFIRRKRLTHLAERITDIK